MRAGAIYHKILEAKMNPDLKNSQASAGGGEGASVCERQSVSKQMLLLLQQCAWISGNVFPLECPPKRQPVSKVPLTGFSSQNQKVNDGELNGLKQ